ncbi:MAG: DNA-binding protein [bacterium]|nr:DNA-binding protein [bacterium]
MADLNITATLSPDDRDTIVTAVVDALRPMIEARTELLVDGDRLAEMIGMSRPTVDRLRAAGIIPSVLSGRCRRYDPAAVIDALRKHSCGGADDE